MTTVIKKSSATMTGSEFPQKVLLLTDTIFSQILKNNYYIFSPIHDFPWKISHTKNEKSWKKIKKKVWNNHKNPT
jgi:hypothetical protein